LSADSDSLGHTIDGGGISVKDGWLGDTGAGGDSGGPGLTEAVCGHFSCSVDTRALEPGDILEGFDAPAVVGDPGGPGPANFW